MTNLQNILNKVKEVTSNEFEFTVGRNKGELVMGEVVTINNYDFAMSDKGPFVVFTVKESDEEYFFGGAVVTTKLQEIKQTLNSEEFTALLEHGIPVTFEKVKSGDKTKSPYTKPTFLF